MPTYYKLGSLWIEIRIREHNHSLPHVHAHFGKYSISIASNGRILSGNLHDRKKNQQAIEWVLKNSDFIESEWRKYHV